MVPMFTYTQTPETIRTRREALGWKPAELAARVRINPATISKIEAGIMVPRPHMRIFLEYQLAAGDDIAPDDYAARGRILETILNGEPNGHEHA